MIHFCIVFYDMMEKIVFVRRGCLVWMNGCAHCRQKWKKNRLCAGSGTVWKWNIEAFAAMKGNWRCCGRKNWKMWHVWNRRCTEPLYESHRQIWRSTGAGAGRSRSGGDKVSEGAAGNCSDGGYSAADGSTHWRIERQSGTL